jgi:predicted ABC-type exoprotein transport system permease subunit
MRHRPSRRWLIVSLVDVLIALVAAAYFYARWRHSASATVYSWPFAWLVICVLYLISTVRRFLNRKQSYFAEEMDHRRALAKEPFQARIQ